MGFVGKRQYGCMGGAQSLVGRVFEKHGQLSNIPPCDMTAGVANPPPAVRRQGETGRRAGSRPVGGAFKVRNAVRPGGCRVQVEALTERHVALGDTPGGCLDEGQLAICLH